MMLEAEVDLFTQMERAVLSPQFPEYPSVAAVDLLDRARVPGGDEIVTS
jgi:hypothetical protein